MKKRNEQRYQYWKDHYQAWQASGRNQSAYCREQSINSKTFNNWIHKNSFEQTSLVKLPAVKSIPESASLEINVGNQIKIKLKAGFNKQLLREVIKALGNDQCL